MRLFFKLWLRTLIASAVKFFSLGPGNQLVTPLGAFTQLAAASLLAGPFVKISAASGAIPQPPNASATPRQPGKYVITYDGGVGAYTLATPVAGIDDGVQVELFNSTAHAHTVTCTAGKIVDGNTSDHNTVFTFNAHIGGNLIVEAYQGKWYVIAEVGGSLTS